MACLYLGGEVLLHVPAVQDFIGSKVATAMERKLGTKVRIGRVDLGFFNRIIIDNVTLWDQTGHVMLRSSRMSVKFDYLPLAQGRISISSTQLFGLRAYLSKKDAESPMNFQFVIDSLASKQPSKPSRLDLTLHSLIIRHGEVSYDQLDKPRLNDFDTHHLKVSNISGHIVLSTLTNDSINLTVKNLRMDESSGLRIRHLSFRFRADHHAALLTDLRLRLPHSEVILPKTSASYRYEKGSFVLPSLSYQGQVKDSHITLSDMAPIMRKLKKLSEPILFNIAFSGTSTYLRVSDLRLSTQGQEIALLADGSVSNFTAAPQWAARIRRLSIRTEGLHRLLGTSAPLTPWNRLGNVVFVGRIGGYGRNTSLAGSMASNVGNARFHIGRHDNKLSVLASVSNANLKTLFNNDQWGIASAQLSAEALLNGNRPDKAVLTATVGQFDYKGYRYHNIQLKANAKHLDNVQQLTIEGQGNINDPNIRVSLSGLYASASNSPKKLTAQVKHLNLAALNLSQLWPGQWMTFNVDARLTGSNLNNANGTVNITDFELSPRDNEGAYTLSALRLSTINAQGRHDLEMKSDFGQLTVNGNFDYRSLPQSVLGFIEKKLPGLRAVVPSLAKYSASYNSRNRFAINANIRNTEFLRRLLRIPITIYQPVTLHGSMDESTHQLDLTMTLPDIDYDGKRYQQGSLHLYTPNDSLLIAAGVSFRNDNNGLNRYSLKASAADNQLMSSLRFSAPDTDHPIHGTVNASTEFFRKPNGITAARLSFLPSNITVGDSLWEVQPSHVVYSKNDINVDHFEIRHGYQHLIANGRATASADDSIFVELKDIDVSYVLNLVNFHSVDFGGKATGSAFVAGVFRHPQAAANLRVSDFTFEDGRMGWLDAKVNWNPTDKQIDINATANDTIGNGLQAYYGRRTDIKGYVSPARNFIDLDIAMNRSRLEFVQKLCDSFMDRMDASANGNIRLSGDLSNINLTGMATADGCVSITPLGTTYSMRKASIRMIPDEIIFDNDTVTDRNGNHGLLTGAIHHKHLTHLSYDLDVKAHNLLSFDQKTFGGNSFCGTVFADGECSIKGRPGEVDINVNATPRRESVFVYNTSSASSVGEQDFIHWTSRDSLLTHHPTDSMRHNIEEANDFPTDIHINFVINCTPDAALKVITDEQTGDYIQLLGDGTLRASYFNKGSFNMFGNYVVDHGIYKLTIQHVIKKDFQFRQGGTIAFGGDPYNAALNLKALYTVNGVSLADLNVGKSFSANNTRVDCIMDITGTPASPKIDFSLDFPTVNSNAKQMIYSLINSEEEMNQQVLYLLAVGQFISQGNNNQRIEGATRQSQISLAMQSILSGTLSQQLNNVLSTVVNNTNWNFGANISTGNEGFYNAEYEGLLSGRMLNNRLVFNGQFGYRDNANATTSFIGDFDLRYLLLPNGNLAIKVYNQTNDRYFTRNSLTTQGIGLIVKKDFSGWRDLFGLKKKTNKKKSKIQKKRETK